MCVCCVVCGVRGVCGVCERACACVCACVGLVVVDQGMELGCETSDSSFGVATFFVAQSDPMLASFFTH